MRKVNQNEVGFDYLTKNIVEFETILTHRIAIGQSLLEKPISDRQELIARIKKFEDWHDFNAELIERSFDKPNNRYYQNYIYVRKPTRVEQMYADMTSRPSATLEDKKENLFEEIRNRVTRLTKLKNKLPLIEVLPVEGQLDEQVKAVENLELLFTRFHKVAQAIRNRRKDKGKERPTILMNDEYDVQDLLKGLLRVFFADVREEDFVSSYAGANSRTDFVLKEEKIVVEIKMTSEKLKDNEVGSQLLLDIARYKSHPDCQLLVIFIYDRGDHIKNKPGLKADLENQSTSNMDVKVFINPH